MKAVELPQRFQLEVLAVSSRARDRIFVDAQGVEWEVYDESGNSAGLALDWDHLPQSNPGLIFVSRLDRRRIWPCPAGWEEFSDQKLSELCARAHSLL